MDATDLSGFVAPVRKSQPLSVVRSKEMGYSDFLLYDSMIAPGVVFGKDASFTAGWYFRGDDLASSTDNELASVSARVNLALRLLGGGWMLHCDLVRRPAPGYPERGAFPDRTTLTIDAERRTQFLHEGTHFESVYALFLTFLPPMRIEGRLRSFVVQGEVSDDGKVDSPMQKALDTFLKACNDFQDRMSSVLKLDRMEDTHQVDEFGSPRIVSELVSYLHYAATGDYQPMVLPRNLMYLDSVIGNVDYLHGLKPKLGKRHMRVVAIDGFPHESYPSILNALDGLPLSYRWTTRFIFLDQEKAKQEIESVRRKWKQKVRGFLDQLLNRQGNINDDALLMTGDSGNAMQEAESGDVRYGRYTATITLMHENLEALELSVRDVTKLLTGKGFGARVEDTNATEAHFGSLPGDGYRNIRRQMVHTMNLADLLPLTAVWSGLPSNPCPFYPPDSPPLAYAATSGATPFRLGLHVGDVGHTLILGPTGAGKSTLLAFLIAQHFRYPKAQVFAFDKGYSLYALTKACGGEHYDIAGDKGGLSFCPLQHIDSDADLAWAVEWVEGLLVLQTGARPRPEQSNKLHNAMMLLRESPRRTLTEFVANVQDKEVRDSLQYFTLEGPMGSLLDAERDTLGTGKFQVFEMEHLMGLGEKAVVPVLLYLFRRIEKRLDGSPTLVPLDEAWIMLGHPTFRERIKEWLKVMRKANAVVMPATQSLSDIFSSSIRDVLLESCPTKILLPNPEAMNETSFKLYQVMGLNETQIHILSVAQQKRHYYYMSPLGRRLFEFGFAGVAMSFIGASSKEDVAAVNVLVKAYGQAWPAEWLRRRGLVDWADFWLRSTGGGA